MACTVAVETSATPVTVSGQTVTGYAVRKVHSSPSLGREVNSEPKGTSAGSDGLVCPGSNRNCATAIEGTGRR